MHLSPMHAQRMGTSNVLIRQVLMEIFGWTMVVFFWFWSWRMFDMQLARQKLGKKNTPPPWRPPLPYGRHGAPPPALPHTTISQHDARQVYVIKTRGYYCFYYFLAL